MTSANNSRYEDILRRIQQRKQQEAANSPNDDLDGILDGVNAFGFLEELTEVRLKDIDCYGPKVVRKSAYKKEAPWVGVVLWHKPRGYYHYSTLNLLGIWAYAADDAAFLTVGTKVLNFSAPVYNPESYYYHLRKNFSTYYEDDGSPPPESERMYQVRYEAGQRLAIRAQIVGELAKWKQQHR